MKSFNSILSILAASLFLIQSQAQCNLEVASFEQECDYYVFEAFNYPENATILWTLDGVVVSDGFVFQYQFESAGIYQVCAMLEIPECPNSLPFCLSIEAMGCLGCPTGWGNGTNSLECDCVDFEIGSFVEGESVIWDFGDGTIMEGGHFIQYCYSNNGYYQASAYYTSPFCEGQEYVFEPVEITCIEECSLIYDVQPGENGVYEFIGLPYPNYVPLEWYVNGEYAGYSENLIYTFETSGVYAVCAFYMSDLCPDGIEYCGQVEVLINSNDCPNEVYMDQSGACGCYVFEIGSFVEGESVVWYFGDGTVVEGGHFIEHCFEEDGNYTVTAFYTSPNCEGAEYVLGVAQVECNPYCDLGVEVVAFDCDSYLFEAFGYPENAQVYWTINEEFIETANVFDYTFQEPGVYVVCASYETPECPNGVWSCVTVEINCESGCPQDTFMGEGEGCGCYVFEIGSFVEGESVVWYFGDGTVVEGGHFIEHCFEEDGNYTVTAFYTSPNCEGAEYVLGVAQVECNPYCDLGVEVVAFDCDSYLFEAFGYPENAQVYWTINEEFIETANAFDYTFQEPGVYVVCASYETPECPYGVWSCVTVEINCESGCPSEFGFNQTNDCGCFVFEIGSFVEGESVVWDYGDGFSEEGGHFTDHCYLEPGIYLVTAFYQSPFCEGETYTFEVNVNCPPDGCPEYTMAQQQDDCHCWIFQVGEGQDNVSAIWSFGDGTEYEGGYIEDHCYEETGYYTVSVFYISASCTGETYSFDIWVECEDCDNVGLAFDSWIGNGGPNFVEWSVSNTDDELIEDGVCQYSNEDPYCDAILCLDPGCYTVDIWSSSPLEGEQVFFSAAFSNGLVLDIVDGPYYDGEYHMQYTFAYESECDQEPCSLEINYEWIEGETYLFDAIASDPEAIVFWDFGDGTYDLGYVIDHTFPGPGEYEICAFYETPDCPYGVEACITIVIGEAECTLVSFFVQAEYNGDNAQDLLAWILMSEGIEFDAGDLILIEGLSSFELIFCMPDGCYDFELDPIFPVLAEFIEITVTNVMTEEVLGNVLFNFGDTEAQLIEFGINSDCTDGLGNLENILFEVWPNPATERLNLAYSGTSVPASFTIYDMNGKVIMAEKLNVNQTQIDVNSMANGVYTITLSGNGAPMVQRFQIIR